MCVGEGILGILSGYRNLPMYVVNTGIEPAPPASEADALTITLSGPVIAM